MNDANHLEQDDVNCESDGSYDCLTGCTTLQCGLSADKLKKALSSVVCKLPRGFHTCAVCTLAFPSIWE